MYLPPHPPHSLTPQNSSKPPFPGFVDIGCGNGVLVDTLLREGYAGWGFDLRARKTWATFVPSTRKHLKELTMIPAPLSADPPLHYPVSPTSTHHRWWSLPRSPSPQPSTHNGLFPPHTFIISNHADELTPWTPLLASLSASPFLCIPCCSHNLSGSRFRAPSVFNNQSADAFAPSYFKNYVTRGKAVAIGVAEVEGSCSENEDEDEDEDQEKAVHVRRQGKQSGIVVGVGGGSEEVDNGGKPETGDLKAMKEARKKQPSAYASLCDWVAHLAAECGYEVEKEMLRMPSTRNVGIVGRRGWRRRKGVSGRTDEGLEGKEEEGVAREEERGVREEEREEAGRLDEGLMRWERVRRIVEREGANEEAWLQRAEGLVKGGGAEH